MAFFSEGDERAKLMILYTLKAFRTPITPQQLYTALLDHNGPNYFELGDLCAKLELEGYLAFVPTRGIQMLFLTQKGDNVCALFEKELTKSLREALTRFADANRDEIKRVNCVVSDAWQLPNGGWNVWLLLLERGDALFELRVRMPNTDYAYNARKNWARDADGIYMEFLTRLIAEPADEESDKANED